MILSFKYKYIQYIRYCPVYSLILISILHGAVSIMGTPMHMVHSQHVIKCPHGEWQI